MSETTVTLSDGSTVTHRLVVVECSCRLCARNAPKIGLSLPLRAEVPEAMAAAVGRNHHGIVHTAHDPLLRGRAPMIRALGNDA